MQSLPQLDLIGGHHVLFVMAAEAEYGPALRERITPLMTGIGPVESAIATASALMVLRSMGSLPDLVVSLGSAGSRVLHQAHVYQVSSVAYRDMDASALGFAKGVTPLLDQPPQISLPYQLDNFPSATLASGASIVSGAAYDPIAADMVDMETFAVLRACQTHGIPMMGLRGISDGVSELSQLSDWTQYLHLVDERLADALDHLAEALETGALSLR